MVVMVSMQRTPQSLKSTLGRRWSLHVPSISRAPNLDAPTAITLLAPGPRGKEQGPRHTLPRISISAPIGSSPEMLATASQLPGHPFDAQRQYRSKRLRNHSFETKNQYDHQCSRKRPVLTWPVTAKFILLRSATSATICQLQ